MLKRKRNKSTACPWCFPVQCQFLCRHYIKWTWKCVLKNTNFVWIGDLVYQWKMWGKLSSGAKEAFPLTCSSYRHTRKGLLCCHIVLRKSIYRGHTRLEDWTLTVNRGTIHNSLINLSVNLPLNQMLIDERRNYLCGFEKFVKNFR